MVKPYVAFLVILIQIFVNTSVKSQDTLSSPYDEKLVEQFLKKYGTKSLVIGVIKDGVQTVKGYGRINSWGKKNITPDGNTVYEIGSITKVFYNTTFG